MAVKLSERDQPESFKSVHEIGYRTPDGHAHIVLSGIALVRLQGNSVEHWRRETYELTVRTDRAVGLLQLPPPPADQRNALRLERSVVFAGLSGLFNKDTSFNAGYAVDGFRLLDPGRDIISDVTIAMDLGVRDVDGELGRVGYHLTLIATPHTVAM